MKPHRFQLLAEGLVEGAEAVQYRTAINRAYYAVYNVGVEALENMGVGSKGGPGSHGDVQHRFSNSGDPDLKRIGTQISHLYTKRLHADYELQRNDVENQKNAKLLVHQAKRMITTIESCCSGVNRSNIIDAIKRWEQLTTVQKR